MRPAQRFTFLLCASFLLALWAQSPQESLQNLADPQKTEKAQEELLQQGEDVVPLLQEQVKILLSLLREIEKKPYTLTREESSSSSSFSLENYYSDKLNEAYKFFNNKNYDKTLAFVDAVLLLEPDNPLRDSFVRLRSKCKEAVFRREVLSASIYAADSYFEMGQKIPLKYVLRNQTEGAVAVPAKVLVKTRSWFTREETIETKAILHIKYTSKDYLGNLSTTLSEQIKTIDQDIQLNSNEQFTLNFSFDPAPFDPEKFLYREFELRLELRPSQLDVASKPTFKSQITSSSVLLKVLPSGLLQFEKEPLPLVQKIYQSKRFDRLFFASLLFHQQQKIEGIDFLIQSLSDASYQERTLLCICLRELTQQNFYLDIDQWKYWWKAKRELYQEEFQSAQKFSKISKE